MQRRSLDSVKIYSPKYSREDMIKILRGKVEAIKEKISIKKIILFGSYAKK